MLVIFLIFYRQFGHFSFYLAEWYCHYQQTDSDPSVWRQTHYDVVSVTSNTLWCRQCDVKHIMLSSVWRHTLWCRQCDVKHIMMSSVWRQTHYDVVSVTSNTLWCHQCDVKHIMMSSVWRQTHYDVISVTSNTLWCHQCDVKHIMMSLIKTVMSVLTVSTYIITSMTACPIILPVIPAIMSGPSQLSLFYL